MLELGAFTRLFSLPVPIILKGCGNRFESALCLCDTVKLSGAHNTEEWWKLLCKRQFSKLWYRGPRSDLVVISELLFVVSRVTEWRWDATKTRHILIDYRLRNLDRGFSMDFLVVVSFRMSRPSMSTLSPCIWLSRFDAFAKPLSFFGAHNVEVWWILLRKKQLKKRGYRGL